MIRYVSIGLAAWAVAIPALAADAPLADAAERGDLAAVRSMIERKAEVNAKQADGTTALHWAARRDDAEAVKALLKANADPNAANEYGVRPLSLACANGGEAVVTQLLDAGADPNASLRGGETPLMTAARTGRVGPVAALLARGADVHAKERRGQTALMWAAAEGHADVVSALVRAGSDVRTALPSGYTPLFFAVREGRSEVVRVLLKAGADVNEPARPTRPVGRGLPDGMSPLALAVENGHFDLALALLDAGADPNDQRWGFTPLHMLTWVRKPNRGDDESGDPAPIGSGRTTSLQLAEALVAHGADVNASLKRGPSGAAVLGRKGATPFLLAAQTADVPLMRTLLRLGADPRRPNAEHSTPLMAAAGLGCLAPGEEAGTEEEALEAVALTLELGNDVNAVDARGETAVHGAAYKNFPQVIDLLARRGARRDVWDRPNRHGWTPLLIAEGHRPGNFKPSPETAAAVRRAQAAQPAPHPLRFIDTGFENASPLWYEVADDATVNLHLVYDHERDSPNRAAGHFHFRVVADKGAPLTFEFKNLDNVYNGKRASVAGELKAAVTSTDGKTWSPVALEALPENRVRLHVTMPGPELYVARVEPYRLSDLDRWLASIRGNPLVEVREIGKTVDGRPLEIVRVGRADAPYRVFLRARAHAWEPGGNWVVEGLVGRLLEGDAEATRYAGLYAVYVLPMANKDGVARGRTRFNLRGKDLNRNWDRPADPALAPENHALESWLERMIASKQAPHLALELHNDGNGRLHLSRPAVPDLDRYLARMKVFESLLREHTWFTEGSTPPDFRNAGTLGDGWLERYGVDAAVHEFNVNRIAGRNTFPTAALWKEYGAGLARVFAEYFGRVRP